MCKDIVLLDALPCRRPYISYIYSVSHLIYIRIYYMYVCIFSAVLFSSIYMALLIRPVNLVCYKQLKATVEI